MRFRNVFLGLGSILTIVVLLLSDVQSGLVQNLPFGAGTVSLLVTLLVSVLFIGLLHISRKALFDYLDLGDLFDIARRTPEGAGLALIAVALFVIAIAITILAATN